MFFNKKKNGNECYAQCNLIISFLRQDLYLIHKTEKFSLKQLPLGKFNVKYKILFYNFARIRLHDKIFLINKNEIVIPLYFFKKINYLGKKILQ